MVVMHISIKTMLSQISKSSLVSLNPHFFAGFSGGPKGIMPGIAGLETIQTFHNAKMIGDPRSTWGNLEDNPVQDMAREVNRMCQTSC